MMRSALLSPLSVLGAAMLVVSTPALADVMGVKTGQLANVCDTTFVASRIGDPEWVILDGRDKDDYAAGHLPGAVSFGKTVVTVLKHPADGRVAPVARAEELLGKLGVGNDKKLIVYGAAGDYHVTIEQYPIYLGVKDFCYLDGGFEAWTAEKRPVSTEPVQPRATVFKASIANPGMYLSTAELIALVQGGAKGFVFVDTRSAKEFNAEENTVIRGGRIPGAINIEVKSNLDPKTGKLLPLDQLAKVYSKVPKDQAVVLYCHRGCRTGYAFYALKALGYPDVRVYEDGYVVWGNRFDTPVENEHYFNLRPFASRISALEKSNEELEAKVEALSAELAKLRPARKTKG